MVEKRKLVSNSLAMLINRLVQSVSTFVLSAAIARTLGADSLGQYLLAFSYYYVFVTIVSQGLKTLFTRELARQPEETPVFLVSGTLLQFGLSCIGYGILVALVTALPYSTETSMICTIMGLTIIPFSLSNITEAVLQAQERMHLIATATVPVYISRLVLMLLIMGQGYGVSYLVGIFALSELAVLVIEWALIVPSIQLKWGVDWAFIKRTVMVARTFFAIEGVAVINDRIQILVLSLLGSEQLVGLYGGIAQLMQPFLIIANSIILAVFPGMSKAIEMGREKQRKIAETIIEMLLCISIPFLVGIYFSGDDLLHFIYGDASFSEATTALRITALMLLVSPFTRTLSYLLVANGLERTNLIEVLITTVVGGTSGIFLISKYHLVGASMMDIVMTSTGASLYIYTVYNRLFSLRLHKILWRPLLISLLMAIVFVILQHVSPSFLITLIVATSSYCLIAGLFMVYVLGMHRAVWEKLVARK